VQPRNPAEKDGMDISRFLLRVCHDLRTPVRAIRAHAELIRKGSYSEGTAGHANLDERLDFIVDGARKIDLLTDGLTSYSIALETEKTSFQPTRMDVTFRTAMARLAPELRDRAAEVICGELPCVSGDPDRLVQVFEKLLQNALRHSGVSAPRIHISADKRPAPEAPEWNKQDEWLFAVRDNGPGIEADYLDLIFKPFERLHSEREGVGMGLAICRVIVERHGGRLWAESTPGIGSTFFFALPAPG
jgi:signal transduction histidine kinase